MNYEEFNSKKYMFLLVLICSIFAIFIIKAFDYLPDQEVVNNAAENINTPAVSENSNQKEIQTDADDTKQQPEEKHGVLYKSQDMLEQEQNFDIIEAPKGAIEEDIGVPNNSLETDNNTNLSPDDRAVKAIVKARNYEKSGDLSSALSEYQNGAEYSNDNEMKALCYEGIAMIYAKQNKYPTALSFAGKAYNTSPSSAREVLIAKIYYSAGKTDIAIKRINNLLKRGFSN